jgi:outer membrane protein OmpA-like peptidoglycan-associated protein
LFCRKAKELKYAVSDDKKTPGPPPDDFSKTTPNINLPDDSGDSDWNKTNYNSPRPAPPDDWGKTVTNIKPINTEQQDYGKTMYPGTQNVPSADWGMTEANVNIREADFGSAPDDFGGSSSERNDKTTPYFSLPEAERQKYQNLPPTPAEKAAQDNAEQKAKGGIPGWVWISAGLLAMFFFMIVVLVAVLFVLSRDSSFEATVKGAPPGSDVLVDEVRWGVTNEDGSIRLMNLKSGRRKVSIVHPSYTCETREINGGDGVTPEPIIARCQAVAVKPGEDCTNIRLGEEDKAERCYNAALDALPDPFTAEELVRALNILVINFDSGSFAVPNKRLAALKKGAGFIAKLQQRQPEVVLELGGHTDNVGGDASNQTLSQNRANAVKDTLVKFGVNANGLQTRGYGSTRPKPGADNSTDQGRFYNRRIEYSIVKK